MTNQILPKQGTNLYKKVSVTFPDEPNHIHYGTIVRDDIEQPNIIIISPKNNSFILSSECQFDIIETNENDIFGYDDYGPINNQYT